MKSFGIWYINDENNDVQSAFNVDLHINLWDISNIEKNDSLPFIDLGLNIRNFKQINKIRLLIPFEVVKENGLKNLTDTFDKDHIANLVFNDDCEINKNSHLFSIVCTEHPNVKKLLYDFKDATIEYNSDNTIINFDLKAIKDDTIYKEFNELYIRFRIESNTLKKELFIPVKEKNWFLESGFKKTQIIDIKFNKMRNMSKNVIKKMRVEKYHFLKFDKIHFLIMEPANNDVEVLGTDFIECRKLEPEWVSYLKGNYILGDVLAYHWKMKAESNEKKIAEYGKMTKVVSATTTWKLIGIYVCVVVIIGLLTNILYSLIITPLVGCIWGAIKVILKLS